MKMLLCVVLAICLSVSVGSPTVGNSTPSSVNGRKMICKAMQNDVCVAAEYCLSWIPSDPPSCDSFESPTLRSSKSMCQIFQPASYTNSVSDQICEKFGNCVEWVDQGSVSRCTTFGQELGAPYSLFCVDRTTVINSADGSSSQVCSEARWCMTVVNASGPSVCETWAGEAFEVGHACAKHWALAEFHRNKADNVAEQLKLAVEAKRIFESELKAARQSREADLSTHKETLGSLNQRIESLQRLHTFSLAKFHDSAARANKLAVQNANWKIHSTGLTLMLRQSIGRARFYKNKVNENRYQRARYSHFVTLSKNMKNILKQLENIHTVQYRLKGSFIRTQMPFTICKQAAANRDSKLAGCDNQDCRTAARAEAAQLCKDWQDIKLAESNLYQQKLNRLKIQASIMNRCSKAHEHARKSRQELKCDYSFSSACIEVEINTASECRPFLSLAQNRGTFLTCNRAPLEARELACQPWKSILLSMVKADNKTQVVSHAIGWASKVRTWGPQCQAAYSSFKTAISDCEDQSCFTAAKTALEAGCQTPASPDSQVKGSTVNVDKNKCPLLRGLCQPDCEVFSNGCSTCRCSATGFVTGHCKSSCANPKEAQCIQRRNLKKLPHPVSLLEEEALLDPFSNADPPASQQSVATFPSRPKSVPSECNDALEAEGLTQTKCATEKDARCGRCSKDVKTWRRSVCAVSWVGRNCRWALGLKTFIMEHTCAGLTSSDLDICVKNAHRASDTLCGKAVDDPVGYHRLFTTRRRCQRAQRKEPILMQKKCSGFSDENQLAACAVEVRKITARKCHKYIKALTDKFESKLSQAKHICDKSKQQRDATIAKCRTPAATPGDVLSPASVLTCQLKCNVPELAWPATCEANCQSTLAAPNMECVGECQQDRLEATESRKDSIDNCQQKCDSCVRHAEEKAKLSCEPKQQLSVRAKQMRSAFRQCFRAQREVDKCHDDAGCLAPAKIIQTRDCAVWFAIKSAYYHLAATGSSGQRCADQLLNTALICGSQSSQVNNTQRQCIEAAQAAFDDCKSGFLLGTCLPSSNYSANKCCPPGASEITNVADCQSAFSLLTAGATPIFGAVATWGGKAQASGARPSGCIMNTGTAKVEFNGVAPTRPLTGNDNVICKRV